MIKKTLMAVTGPLLLFAALAYWSLPSHYETLHPLDNVEGCNRPLVVIGAWKILAWTKNDRAINALLASYEACVFVLDPPEQSVYLKKIADLSMRSIEAGRPDLIHKMAWYARNHDYVLSPEQAQFLKRHCSLISNIESRRLCLCGYLEPTPGSIQNNAAVPVW